MRKLLDEISACTLCRASLPLGPRPVVAASAAARILIIGQAPGRKVHATGIPWNDASGKELRRWLGVTEAQFYNKKLFALVPMGFCYPGRGASGDLPPRPECAATWHEALLKKMKHVQLTILIGQYAQHHYLQNEREGSLTETVLSFRKYLPRYLPLVHPSPRNKAWHKKNPWFEQEVVPALQARIAKLI
jgi:uracil-DNA glycosylase